jgi:hypothetical protein
MTVWEGAEGFCAGGTCVESSVKVMLNIDAKLKIQAVFLLLYTRFSSKVKIKR